ncbi:uncharacterized protein LOC130623485 [Hydractinia symbiolongicarpus]|uniref:uncharacterized protein LOC130623485 n=1 Tax=Hydractinia symbiolongicarpus TaxID=13093 RepID=UPI00254DDB6E|nr:uncharacterized protein LOC130623485 [Hydractinia symbiolongicarpus]
MKLSIDEQLLQDMKTWLSVQLCLLDVGKTIVLEVIHTVLPTDSEKLSKKFLKDKKLILEYISEENKYIFNAHDLHSRLFSLTLCRELIIAYNLMKKVYTSKKPPKESAIDPAAHLWRLVELQKELLLPDNRDINKAKANALFNKLDTIFKGLGFHGSIDKYQLNSFTQLKCDTDEVYVYEALRNATLVQLAELKRRKLLSYELEQLAEKYDNIMKAKAKVYKQTDTQKEIINKDEWRMSLTKFPVQQDESSSEESHGITEDIAECSVTSQEPIDEDEHTDVCDTTVCCDSFQQSNEDLTRVNTTYACVEIAEEKVKEDSIQDALKIRTLSIDGKLPPVPKEDPEIVMEIERLEFGLKVEDLRFSVEDKISRILDDDMLPNSANYIALAEQLGVSEDNITLLKLQHSGGGNPALNFLEDLRIRHALKGISELIEVIEEDGNYAEGLIDMLSGLEEKTFNELPRSVMSKLSTKLLQQEQGKAQFSSWRNLADSFDYDVATIDSIAVTIRQNAQYSPTQVLFRLLRQQQPDLRLSKISSSLEAIGNKQAKQVLDKFMETSARKRSKRNIKQK